MFTVHAFLVLNNKYKVVDADICCEKDLKKESGLVCVSVLEESSTDKEEAYKKICSKINEDIYFKKLFEDFFVLEKNNK